MTDRRIIQVARQGDFAASSGTCGGGFCPRKDWSGGSAIIKV
jgi:hypothetical protein